MENTNQLLAESDRLNSLNEVPTLDNAEELEKELIKNRVFLEEKKYDEAIGAYKNLCEKSLSIYKSEMCYEMAKFYYAYGNALTYKIENTFELFGEVLENKQNDQKDYLDDEEQDENDEKQNEDPKTESNDIVLQNESQKNIVFQNDEVKISDETGKTIENLTDKREMPENTIIETNDKEEEKIEDIDLTQLAWENLEVAQVIAQKEYERLRSDISTKKEQIESVLKFLARVTLRIGDLESLKDNFEAALSEYIHCLEIRQIFDDQLMSRDISEIYFLIGNTHLYIAKEDCDDKALHAFNESRIILENLLKIQLGFKLEARSLFEDDSGLNKDLLIEKKEDSLEIQDLKQVLKMLYEKIEDTMNQKAEKDQFKLEQEKMKQIAETENKFGPSIFDKSNDLNSLNNNKENIIDLNKTNGNDVKIRDLGIMGNARKRPNSNDETTNNFIIPKIVNKKENDELETAKNGNPNNFEHENKRLKLQE